MALVNYSIPNLIGGVSQQAAQVRTQSQVEIMENMIPSVASGLRRRAGSQHRAKLVAGDHTDAFVHAIDRGTLNVAERYFVVITEGALNVYDYSGTPLPVTFPNGVSYLGTNVAGSTATSPCRDTFVATSVADYTFIVNKNVTVVMGALGPYTPPPQTLYVVVKIGVVSTTYYVNLNGVVFSYTSSSTDTQTQDVRAALVTAINAGGLFTATAVDNLITVVKNDGTNFTWDVTDGYGNQAIFGFTDKVNRYEQLPQTFIENVVVQVQGDPNNADNSFYVQWKKATATGSGVWVETIKPNIQTALSAPTMPHILVRNPDNSFVFKEATWTGRLIGDDTSSPVPSFVNNTVANVFFSQNRLGLLSGENVILSEAAAYFNFFATSARAVVDSDPIDMSASTNKVSFLRHAVPFNKSILIFADKQQFVLTGTPVMKPGSARLDPTTAFTIESTCPPATMGRTVFFPVPRGDFTAIREYFFDGLTVADDATNTTAHVPAYIPGGVFRITAVPTEDMILVLTTKERNAVYVYNSFWNGDQKLQSAWHKWIFDPADIIVAADVFNSRLITITQRADGCYLDEHDLSEQSPTFVLCMDRLVAYNTGTYNDGQKMTFWTLPYAIPAGATMRVVIGQVSPTDHSVAQGLIASYAVGNVIGLKGNYNSRTAIIGVQYASRIRMSEQFFIFKSYLGQAAIMDGRLQLRTITFAFNRTGFFEVRVYPSNRPEQRYPYTGQLLGQGMFALGTDSLEKGAFTAPIMANSRDVDIDLYNDTHLPSIFLSAEVQGQINMQSTRRW